MSYPTWDAGIVESIKEVLGQGLSYHESASKIREASPEAGAGPELALIKALDYHAVPRLGVRMSRISWNLEVAVPHLRATEW